MDSIIISDTAENTKIKDLPPAIDRQQALAAL